jgi:hypothetical protein
VWFPPALNICKYPARWADLRLMLHWPEGASGTRYPSSDKGETVASTPSINEILDGAATAIKRGDTTQGRETLRKVLEAEPRNVWALLWMTKCTEDPYQKVALFQLVLELYPGNPHALKGLQLYSKYVKPRRQPIPKPPSSEPAVSAADFEPTPPTSHSLSAKALNVAIAFVSLILCIFLCALAATLLPQQHLTQVFPTSEPVQLPPAGQLAPARTLPPTWTATPTRRPTFTRTPTASASPSPTRTSMPSPTAAIQSTYDPCGVTVVLNTNVASGLRLEMGGQTAVNFEPYRYRFARVCTGFHTISYSYPLPRDFRIYVPEGYVEVEYAAYFQFQSGCFNCP